MILDTTFLRDLTDGDQDAFLKAVTLYEDNIVQRIALPSVWELQYGAEYTQSEEEVRKVRNLLVMYPLVELTEETARLGAELLAQADRDSEGESGIDTEAALIAAVGKHSNEPVLTRNEPDFSQLGVPVETY